MTRSKSIKAGLGVAICATILLGAAASPALARWGDRDDHREHRHDWNGGYYRAPPVIYGGHYNNGYGYAPPPVVYGPRAGVFLPGINLYVR